MEFTGLFSTKAFRGFLFSGGKNIFFTSLFYSVWLVYRFSANADLTLRNFEGRMIGSATLNAYDINARVKLFYAGIGILLAAFLLFNLLGFVISRSGKQFLTRTETKIINYSALAGLSFFLFNVFGFKTDNALELVYFFHKLMLMGLLLQASGLKTITRIRGLAYAIILTLSFSLCFLVSDLIVFAGAPRMPDLWVLTFIICLAWITTSNLWKQSESKLFYCLAPLAFLPFISLLKNEIFLILKGKGHSISPILIFVVLLVILCVIVFIRYRKFPRIVTPQKVSLRRLLSYGYFPLFIFSLVSNTYYSSYFLKDNIQDMFEPANRYLPILELQNFGTIPFIEKFNSHLLSDVFFNGIYAFFNDLKVNDSEIYDFLAYSVMACLYYYLFLWLTRNPFVAIYFILFFPFYYSLCPSEHAFAALGIFALYRIVTSKQQTRDYVILFFTIFFLLLWRIDVGYPFVILTPLVLLLIHFFTDKTKINFKALFKGAAIIALAITSIVCVLCWVRNTNLFSKIPYILNYLSSAQTYGLQSLGDQDSPVYKLHYFVIPFFILAITLYGLLSHRRLTTTRSQRIAFLALMTLCFYYFVNLQRGLVRHSLYEGTDNFISSFFYLIVVGVVFIFMRRQSSIIKFSSVVILSFFILLFIKVPTIKGSSAVFESTFSTLLKPVVDLDTLQSRTIKAFNQDTRANDKKDLIAFLKAKLNKDQTFIDFTNTSMLYFYTVKETPSFFYQNPICSHNEFLQNKFIEDLKNYNTPYLLFDLVNGPNQMDDVPNCFRHYRLAEYFYEHFEPDTIIDGVSAWKKVGEKRDTISHWIRPSVYDLKKLPYIWANYDKKVLQEKKLLQLNLSDTLTVEGKTYEFNNFDKAGGNTLILELSNLSDTMQHASISLGSNNTAAHIQFDVLKSSKPLLYAIRVSAVYTWFLEEGKRVTLSGKNRLIKLNSITLTRE